MKNPLRSIFLLLSIGSMCLPMLAQPPVGGPPPCWPPPCIPIDGGLGWLAAAGAALGAARALKSRRKAKNGRE